MHNRAAVPGLLLLLLLLLVVVVVLVCLSIRSSHLILRIAESPVCVWLEGSWSKEGMWGS